MGFCIVKVFIKGREAQRWQRGPQGVLLCPVPLNAVTERARFVPTALVLVVGHCLILGLVTPHDANPSCKKSSSPCSEQDSLVGGMC